MKLTQNRAKVLVGMALLEVVVAPALAADASNAERHRQDYGQEGAEISRWQRAADRLYAQFKPREAPASWKKSSRLTAQTSKRLVKLARAHIDIGDHVEEGSADWKERRLKEYSTAEAYARKSVEVDPGSTWGHFWIAGRSVQLLDTLKDS